MKKMGIGLQLYTVRDEMAKDFTGTLRKVAEMGYEGVEFAGYGGLSAEELKALLDELNLKAFASHVGYHLLKENLEREIAYLKTIGAKYAVVPYLAEEDRNTEEKWQQIFADLTAFGKEMNKHGIVLAYHNHNFEFENKIGGKYVFDVMYEKVPADLLKLEIDAGWVGYVNEDPVAYVRKYSGRVPLVHLKDFRKGKPGEPIDTVELGAGDLQLKDIIAAASDAGTEWLIVEQDVCKNPPLESVKTSLEWLRNNYLNQLA